MIRYCRLFNVFEEFFCKIGGPHVFSCSGIKVVESFPIISNLAVTTRITINYSRVEFFLKWIFKSKQCVKSSLRSKNSLSIVCLSLLLKSNENLPKYGKTKVNSLLGAMKLRSFLINNLFKNFLIHWFTKFWEYIIPKTSWIMNTLSQKLRESMY